MRRPHRATTLIALATLLAAGVASCGGGDSADTTSGSIPAPSASAFPAPKGNLQSLGSQISSSDQYVVLPAGKVFSQGRNRFSFGVFSPDGDQITDAQVAIYAAHGASGAAEGPFPARVESLKTEPQFTAKTTSEDPDAARAVYVTEINFDKPGEWRLLAAVQQDSGKPLGTVLPSINVKAKDLIPGVGDKAPVIHTPTVDDVGDVSQIDTRQPPDDMHDVDFADVVGKKPVVLLFATPALCTSRVCGPVVDVEEQVKNETDDDVAFIHQEIYNDNNPNKGPRPQVKAYNLQSEPWLFVVGADGRISTRIEGAFSVSELEDAVAKVTG